MEKGHICYRNHPDAGWGARALTFGRESEGVGGFVAGVLVDLGVPAFLVLGVLCGVLGQELMLTPCPACGGNGCAVCGGTGGGERRLRTELWLG